MMVKIKLFVTLLTILLTIGVSKAQVGIQTDTPRTTLEIGKLNNGNNPQGLLLPSLTQTEIDNMTIPPEGTLVYNESKHCLHVYKYNIGWECVDASKQVFAITYEGVEGSWVKNLPTTDRNVVKFKVINNLEVPFTRAKF